MKKYSGSNGIIQMMVMAVSIILFPVTSYALGDFHLYATPGAWAQDIPTCWFVNMQLRYVSYDHAFDSSGDRKRTLETDGFQSINKIGHFQRLTDQWQLSNVLVAPIFADIRVRLPWGGDMTTSGMADPVSTNYVGWHNKANNLHLGFGGSISFPVGDYDKSEKLNLGENRWKIYFPFFLLQYRKPISDGLLLIEWGFNFEWRLENHDTDWDDHDVSEHNVIITYWLNRQTMKLGFFIQPDLQFALNESELYGMGQDDDDFYTFGGAIGVVYTPKPNCMLNLKYTREIVGRGLNNGAFAPETNAIHFIWAWLFL